MENRSDFGKVTGKSVLQTIPMILLHIISFFGNFLVLLAIYRFKSMRTYTNMYIASISIIDLTGSLLMPFSYITVLTNGKWVFGEAMCSINAFCLTFLASASFFSLSSFSLFRCYMVTTVQKRISVGLLGKTVKISLVGIWVLSFINASPPLFGAGELRFVAPYYSCILDFGSSTYYAGYLFLCVFSMPLMGMIIAYITIAKFMRMHARTIRRSSASAVIVPGAKTNRNAVTEVKNDIGLDNKGIDKNQMVQNQRNDFTSQKTDQAAQVTQQIFTDEKMPLQALETRNTKVTFTLKPNKKTPDNLTPQLTLTKDERRNIDGESSSGSENETKVQKPCGKISKSSVAPKMQNTARNNNENLRQYQKRVAHQVHLSRILLMTVVAFLICWAPFAVDSFLLGIGYSIERPNGFQLVSQWMAFSNSICDPFIYCMLNQRFRTAFKTILKDLWGKIRISKS